MNLKDITADKLVSLYKNRDLTVTEVITGVYEEIDMTEWIAGNPADVPATNFGRPASVFEKFPRKDLFIAGLEECLAKQG